jgi:hypothetical protein
MPIARDPRAHSCPRRLIQSFTLFVLLLSMALIVPAGTVHSAQVTLSWNPNPEPDIAGYKVYYGTGSRIYSWFFDVGNVTTHTITNLPDGTTYYFAATAYDTTGLESTKSGEATTTTCTFTISPPSQSFTSSNGTGSVSVTAPSSCSWSASTNASWMTITSGSSGKGNGTVNYSVTDNTTPTSRTASCSIAKNVFNVTQAGTSNSAVIITASAGSGGSISPSGEVSVGYGSSKTFTIKPKGGRRVSDVKVDGVSVGAVTTYTFTNVTANRTIAAYFALKR